MGGPARREAREFLDTPGQDPHELSQLLLDIRRANHRYGGRRLVLRYLEALLPQISRRPIALLDVATGGADIPAAVVAWAEAHAIQVRVVGIDLSPEILTIARDAIAPSRAITLVRADALRLPFADGAFDVVICGLALHHFTLPNGAAVLREIDRVAREAFVVHDIVRSWPAYAGAWLDTRLFARSRLARHDGPVSVLRSFTLPELHRMVRLAAIPRVELHTLPMFRVALVRRPGGGRA